MKAAILGLLFLVCAVSAHYRCTPPQVWEGKLSEYFLKMGISVPYGRLSYDGENRRTRTIEVVYNNTQKSAYDILYYQRCRTMFIYNLNTKACQRIKVNYPWKPMEIPKDATYLGDAYAGSAGVPQGGLLVQTWTGNTTEHGGYTYMFTLTRHGCIPLSYTGWGKQVGLISANFYDIVLGIDDPNVFRPPAACYEQGQVKAEDHQYIDVPVAAEHLRRNQQVQNNKSKLYRLIQRHPNVL